MISYAQNFEDVMTARLFDQGHRGFYIDIGAAHPVYLSVTCHFYNKGWTGVNVEPTQRFHSLLCEARPKDINLQIAIGRDRRRANLFEIPEFAENSTLDPDVAAKLALADLPSVTREVDVITLAELCDKYAADRTIDFMKIDVEGGELDVLTGGNWEKYRPRLLIVEATEVNSRVENWAIWEPILVKARYHKVWFDGLNNFYLREEDLALQSAFRIPPGLIDNIENPKLAELKLAELKLAELAELKLAEQKLAELKLAELKLAELKLAELAELKLTEQKFAELKLAELRLLAAKAPVLAEPNSTDSKSKIVGLMTELNEKIGANQSFHARIRQLERQTRQLKEQLDLIREALGIARQLP